MYLLHSGAFCPQRTVSPHERVQRSIMTRLLLEQSKPKPKSFHLKGGGEETQVFIQATSVVAYFPGGGATGGLDGPSRGRHFGVFPKDLLPAFRAAATAPRGLAGQDECDRPRARHGGRGAALQRAAPQQLVTYNE